MYWRDIFAIPFGARHEHPRRHASCASERVHAATMDLHHARCDGCQRGFAVGISSPAIEDGYDNAANR